MGKGKHRPRQNQAELERHGRNSELSQALHRSIVAHLTRLVIDPDRPEQQITYDELEQRLRARAYRQAAHRPKRG